MSLESRINGLLSSWNIERPFAVALKLVMDEWNLGNNQTVNAEKDLYKEQYSHERFCFTSPMKKTQYLHHGQSNSQTKFSYETNIDAVPPTNLKGK